MAADKGHNDYFDELESEMRQALARELTTLSGLGFKEDNDKKEIIPENDMEARLLQSGSASLGRAPESFLDQSVAIFASKADIKRG